MKRFLLLICVCAFPCLLSAQYATVKNVLKGKMSIQQVLKNLPPEKLSQVTTRAGAASNLPDSIYAYNDAAKKDLYSKTFITYNADGLPTEQREVGASGWEEKTVWTYTLKNGLVTVEEISYYLRNGVWEAESKMVVVLKEPDLVNPIEIYYYAWEGEWIQNTKAVAIEFDAAKHPTVYELEMLSYDEDDKEITINAQMEVAYYANGLMHTRSILIPTGNPAEPSLLVQKEEYFYDDALQNTKIIYTDNLEGDTYINEMKYDEKGNVNYAKYEYESFTDETYYTNFYPTDNANDVIHTVQTVVYPNPASDVLNVRIGDAGEALITMVNMTGNLVFQQKTNQAVTSIPLQSFAKGYYILTIQAGAGITTHKVIVR